MCVCPYVDIHIDFFYRYKIKIDIYTKMKYIECIKLAKLNICVCVYKYILYKQVYTWYTFVYTLQAYIFMFGRISLLYVHVYLCLHLKCILSNKPGEFGCQSKILLIKK